MTTGDCGGGYDRAVSAGRDGRRRRLNLSAIPKTGTPITSIDLDLTLDCNMRCVYCFKEKGSHKCRQRIAFDSVVWLLLRQRACQEPVRLPYGRGAPSAYGSHQDPRAVRDTSCPLLRQADPFQRHDQQHARHGLSDRLLAVLGRRFSFVHRRDPGSPRPEPSACGAATLLGSRRGGNPESPGLPAVDYRALHYRAGKRRPCR